jgi:hypothetical protein
MNWKNEALLNMLQKTPQPSVKPGRYPQKLAFFRGFSISSALVLFGGNAYWIPY